MTDCPCIFRPSDLLPPGLVIKCDAYRSPSTRPLQSSGHSRGIFYIALNEGEEERKEKSVSVWGWRNRLVGCTVLREVGKDRTAV
jgi:hypothetical protein